MFEKRLRDRLRKDLEGPALLSPRPSQARYVGRQSAGRYPLAGWFRVGGAAFAAGALAAIALLSVGTGSTNPQVWTVRVASALTQLTEPAAATPTPSGQTAAPSSDPERSGGAGSSGGPAAEPSADAHSPSPTGASDDRDQSPSPSPTGDDKKSNPAPSASPDGPGSGAFGGPNADPHGHGSPDSAPAPTPAPEAGH